MLKECFKCHELLPIYHFYKHKKMADGYLNKCKECTKLDVSNHRSINLDKIRAYDRERSKNPDRRKHISNNAKEWRKKNPIGYMAHTMLNNAIRDGKIKKQPCEICGSTYMIHGHHDDYYRPLEVRWLCPKHHAKYISNNKDI